ncbi:hypothetical protein KAU33_05660 [Candidatus Dependentiae bacterium]|nr:hypothetical protein [Candidatus Dependentiae bacterium]
MIETEINKFNKEILALFKIKDKVERKKKFENIYNKIDNKIFHDILLSFFTKFFKLEYVLNFEGTVDDFRQTFFLDIWKALENKENKNFQIPNSFLEDKIKQEVVGFLKEHIRLLSTRLNELIDVEAGMTIRELEGSTERKPLYIVLKLEYFKQFAEIFENGLDFLEKTIFILRFFLEIPDNIIAAAVEVNHDNLINIYNDSRLKILIKLAQNRMFEFEPVFDTLKEINSLDNSKELEELEDYDIYKKRCLESFTTEQICKDLDFSPQEFRLRLLDFFSKLTGSFRESKLNKELKIRSEDQFNKLLDQVFELKQLPNQEVFTKDEELIISNFRFLLEMSRIDYEYVNLRNLLKYRLSVDVDFGVEEFLLGTGLNKSDFEMILKGEILSIELLDKITDYFHLPKNYLIEYNK